MSLHATHRDAGQVTVVDLSGRIVLGEGSALLRTTVRGLLVDERKNILLNLADVDYICQPVGHPERNGYWIGTDAHRITQLQPTG